MSAPPVPTVEIAQGVFMPFVNLGTCCGSEVNVGLPEWLAAGGTGIDTALDYGKAVGGGKQTDIRAILNASSIKRSDLFLTTKIPAGFGIGTGGCLGGADKSVAQVQQDLSELGVEQVDLVLLHAPCHTAQLNADAWKGLEQALAMNLTRAIGVSNYKADQLEALLATATVKPAVNQCLLSIGHHDDETIAYSQQHGITYEAYEAMRGCPFDDADVLAMAAAHGVSVSQICLRWVVQKGAVIAVGLGKNATKAAGYAESNLDLFGFNLSEAEMSTLDAI